MLSSKNNICSRTSRLTSLKPEIFVEKGAQLVQLRSKIEIDFINNHLITDGFWIGAQTLTGATPTDLTLTTYHLLSHNA